MDPILLVGHLLLLALGANVVAASEPDLYTRHLVRAGLSLLAAFLASRIPIKKLVDVSLYLYVGGLLLLLATLVYGVDQNTNSLRWLNIGGFSIQPSEFIKLFLILYLARFLSKNGPDHLISGPAVMAGAAAVLVVMQPDLDTAAFILLLTTLILVIAGVPIRRLFGIGVAALLTVMATQGFFIKRLSYVTRRLEAFLKKEQVDQTASAQEAIARGLPFGRGPGDPVRGVPLAHNDMAYAALTHSLGVIGSLILFSAYTLILGRGLQIAARTSGAVSITALGVTLMIALEAALHIAVVTGLLPVFGLPLPLVSYGGSSMLTFGLAIGLLHSAAREMRREEEEDLVEAA